MPTIPVLKSTDVVLACLEAAWRNRFVCPALVSALAVLSGLSLDTSNQPPRLGLVICARPWLRLKDSVSILLALLVKVIAPGKINGYLLKLRYKHKLTVTVILIG